MSPILGRDDEFKDTIVALYQKRLGRAPDYLGFCAWLTNFRNGMTGDQMDAALLASEEGQAYAQTPPVDPPPPPPAPSPFPQEYSRLLAVGRQFRRAADATTAAIRGATLFMAHARYLRGEPLLEQLDWSHRLGINLWRVFFRVPWGGEWEFYRRPEADPDYRPSRRAFFTLLRDHGIFGQAVALTAREADSRRIVQELYDDAEGFWNVTPQIANEPHVNGIDTRDAVVGLARHGLLSCSGDYLVPSFSGPAGDGVMPANPNLASVHVLDYGDLHTERSFHVPAISSDRYPRNGKEPKEFADSFGCPWIDGEPLGFWEQVRMGSGARTTDVQAAVSHHAIARLLCAGQVIHTQAGLEGRAPDPTREPVQTALCEAISKVWRFIPDHAYTGAYSRPGLTPDTFPLQWQEADSLVAHAYATLHATEGWAVNPMPRDGWAAQGANGWTVAETLPGFPFVVRVVR